MKYVMNTLCYVPLILFCVYLYAYFDTSLFQYRIATNTLLQFQWQTSSHKVFSNLRFKSHLRYI